MFLSKIKSFPFAILVGIAVIFAGCGTGSDSETGSMEVRLHDAPANFDAVNVSINRVEVNNAETDTGWIVINEPDKTFNLLELTNGAFEVLGEKELETGLYPQIRLILNQDGHSVVIDGQQNDLMVPSGAQTGIKLNVNAEIEPDIEYVLLLDFDASRSVVKAGNQQSGIQYLLKPVVRATNKAVTGNIAGVVDPGSSDSFVFAISGSDTLSSTKADTANGEFQLVGLKEGTYDVSVDPQNSTYSDTTVTGVDVTVGETNDIGTIELSQN